MKILLLIILIAIAVVLFLASRKPKTSRYAREITVKAAPETVFEHIHNLKNYNEWNPWAAADPTVVNTFDGPDEGVGSSMSWVGKKTGQGRMEVRETTAHSHVAYNLHFIKPFAATARVDFHIKPVGDETKVTWAFEGDNNLMSRIFQVFVNMEKMMGNSFDDGLSRLKAIVEKG